MHSSEYLTVKFPFLQVVQCPGPSSCFHQLSHLYFQAIFFLKFQSAPLQKAIMACPSSAARLVIGKQLHNLYLITYNRINLQTAPKSAKLRQRFFCNLGSSNSISDHKAVRETIAGMSDGGPVLNKCFDFET